MSNTPSPEPASNDDDQPENLDPESDSVSRPASRSRRDFLSVNLGPSTSDQPSDSIAQQMPPEVVTTPNSLAKQIAYLEDYSHRAMACDFSAMFNMQQYNRSGSAAMAAFELLDQLEDQLSIYRDTSELSRLNRDAAEGAQSVEAGLFGVLQLGQRLHQETGGAFDYTARPLTRLWGFDRRQAVLADETLIQVELENVGAQHVQLWDPCQLKFNRPGVSIDLGGIGKGYSIDRATKLIESYDIRDFLIHGGQSSVTARGHRAVPVDERSNGWTIGISHPTIPNVRLAELYLRDQSLGTSGSGRQGFFHQGNRYGHIIDPRTGWPTNHFLSTTVISETAAVSDALATAFFVMTLEQIAKYCSRHNEVRAIVLRESSKKKLGIESAEMLVTKIKGGLEIVTFNLGADDWKPLV